MEIQSSVQKTNRFFPVVPIIVVTAICLFFTQAAPAATVNIDLNTTNQTIRGFGGMNFPRWIGTLTNTQVDTAFGNGSGQIGLTILRIDVPPSQGDWDGEISAAVRAISHGAIVFASPWSPPAYMKTNGDLVGGELDTDYYDDYAIHLSDFADHMSTNGASLYAISLQNEPDISVSYESCDWTSTQMRNFLKNNASVIPTRVMVAESFNFNHSFTDPILNDSAAEAELEIIAGHIYGGGLADYPLARSKGKEIWMTEHYTDSENDADLWPNALNVGKEIHDCMAANMNAYIWWYIRRFYGPIAEDGHITKRGYCMSHFAKFVRPGYTRISATANPQSGVYVTAYKSGDTLAIVAVNQNSSSQSVTFSLSGGSVTSYTKYVTNSSNSMSNQGSVGSTNTLAANSINTFVGTIGGTADTTPPTPDPMTWSSYPTATGSSTITMTASTATDADSPPVEYYFECTNDGSATSGWQSSTTYIASGLDAGTQYWFRVKARDSYVTPNETDWSSTQSATTFPPDSTPPTPDPMTWSSYPTATGSSTITMTASTATDTGSPPVQYYFECTTDGSATSGWQSSATYVASGLTPDTLYSFRVKARDSATPVPNETGWSSIQSATTNAGTGQTPYPGPDLHAIPGRIEAENYDDDGEGVAYHDTTSGNEGGAYRSDDVDVETCGEGGYNVGWIANGEWLEYSVNIATTGTYDIEARVASDSGGGDFHIEFDGYDVTGTVSFAATGGWQDYTSVYVYDVSLTAGIYIMRVSMDSDYWNLNWVEFTSTGGYQNCAEVQAGGYGLESDLTADCYVDYEDLEIITDYWLSTSCTGPDNCEGADFEPTDGSVDFYDFSNFAVQWLLCNDPEDSNCPPNW